MADGIHTTANLGAAPALRSPRASELRTSLFAPAAGRSQGRSIGPKSTGPSKAGGGRVSIAPPRPSVSAAPRRPSVAAAQRPSVAWRLDEESDEDSDVSDEPQTPMAHIKQLSQQSVSLQRRLSRMRAMVPPTLPLPA